MVCLLPQRISCQSNVATIRISGSLTTPPCTEGVTWFVMKTPEEISRGEVEVFAKLYPHDVRPAQKVEGRVIRESK